MTDESAMRLSPVLAEDFAGIASSGLPLDRLAGSTLLITGANGYIAAYLAEALMFWNQSRTGAPVKIIALVRNRAKAAARFSAYLGRPDFKMVVQDVCDPLNLNEPVHYVIHAASQSLPKNYGADPAGTIRPNVAGIYNLLEFCRRQPCRSFLFLSSGEVYGRFNPPPAAPLPENVFGSLDPLDPRSCYAESKRMGEAMCKAWLQYGVPAKIARLGHTYGPGMDLNDGRVFADFTANIVRGENIVLKSDGQATRPFCYLSDAVKGLLAILLTGEPGEAYNLANTDAQIRISALAALLCGLFPEKKLKVVNAAGEGAPVSGTAWNPGIVVDTGKIRKLGWKPEYGIEAGFRRTILSYGESGSVYLNLPARKCPVCSGVDRKLLYRQKFSSLSGAGGSFMQGYDVCVCVNCGAGFADGLPPQEEFDRYYSEMSQWEFEDNKGVESPQDSARFDSVVNLFAGQNLKQSARILDIGCATGGMLAAFKRKGYTDVLGLDPSPRCAELAKKNYGVEVVTGTVKELGRLSGRFDAITLSGVLEHFNDPQAALADVRKLLADDGLFYVNVPDSAGFVECMDGPYQQFSIEHIIFFTSASLVNLMRKCGFETVKMSRTAQQCSLSHKYPGVEAIFRKAPAGRCVFDASTEPSLAAYIRASESLEAAIRGQLQSLARSGEPVLVWGLGTNTRHLLACGRLAGINIKAFVDSNPHYHGKTMSDRPVLSPAELPGREGTILIASVVYAQEISRQIRQGLKLENRLLILGQCEPVACGGVFLDSPPAKRHFAACAGDANQA